MGIGSLNVVSKYSYLLFICLIAEVPVKQTVDILHLLLVRLKNSRNISHEFLHVYKSLLQCKRKMKHEQEQKLCFCDRTQCLSKEFHDKKQKKLDL